MNDPRKFHLDDPAAQEWRGYAPFTHIDHVSRPWRFAHRNPMPYVVLFPRIERAATCLGDVAEEARWRIWKAWDILRRGDGAMDT